MHRSFGRWFPNESVLLPASAILSPDGDASTWRLRRFRVTGSAVDRVSTALHLRAVGLGVVDSLIERATSILASGRRSGALMFGTTVLEWTPSTAVAYEDCGLCVDSSESCGAAELPIG
ncbi:MAG: hypothetical protein JKY37_05835 [Nannocystaceae bacterium]|nr:hypothetical protein [Nannocystaceae bacterium]